ncbi:hypothetical protein RO21_05520 [[Actinobacillus] muris]|uniref:Transferrin-binding protein B C-lobe/N-lobe beta-barrel domain-containing protein n=1 Tax=Muribacter muris TaxID=67855 RepID=A0A0J5P729_9PAST|nr:transferrin-binding protein-like solute binding protein [Muribacter muris]KMK51585.1 hypothetical protein RO21_05520 [[Actinobacillus] muris] [Muribacter muris]
MKKLLSISITMLTSLVITACGSGSSSSSSKPESVNNSTPPELTPPVAENNAKPSEVTPPVVNDSQPKYGSIDKKIGNIYEKNYPMSSSEFHSKDEHIKIIDAWNDKSEATFNFVRLESGEFIPVLPEGMGSSIEIKSSNMTRLAQKYLYTVSGYVNEKSPEVFVVAQGRSPTKDMPVSGIINYHGVAFHGTSVPNGINFERGDISLVANFDDKSITGKISSPQKGFAEVEIGANIKGNYFEGKHSNGINLTGGFFGPNAAEVTGRYLTDPNSHSEKAVIGVFNAKKK